MRTLVLQIDDRLSEDWQMPVAQRTHDAETRVRFTERNRSIACDRGWLYDLRVTGDENMPPWWWKVFALRDIFRSDPTPDDLLILWMDTDSLLNDECSDWSPLEIATRDPDMSMWITPDAPPSDAVFNAGVFLVRGTPAGRRILDDWCALYNPSFWARIPWSSSGSSRMGMSRYSRPPT